MINLDDIDNEMRSWQGEDDRLAPKILQDMYQQELIWTVGWRYGQAPPLSTNWRTDDQEIGVSMMQTTLSAHEACQEDIALWSPRGVYVYVGWQIMDTFGSDGEPLMVGLQEVSNG